MQGLADAMPYEWIACCGSDVNWAMVDAELEFQARVDDEHGVVYGNGSENMLDYLLRVHTESGYALRAEDAEAVDTASRPEDPGPASPKRIVVPQGCTLREVSEAFQMLSEDVNITPEFGAMVLNYIPGCTPKEMLENARMSLCDVNVVPASPKRCTEGVVVERRGLVEVKTKTTRHGDAIGKRELRRQRAVVSAPIVAKIVAEVREQLGNVCLGCRHESIAEVIRDCKPNYSSVQWTVLRIMKERKLHAAQIQLYLDPVLVAYFRNVQYADGTGGYRGFLGSERKRIWRRRHNQVA